ncbi:hypothetical protein SDC9_163487 [bioreactor metagenome]|uniref:Uncharacterized protein n=1 Tax=bioreactor metagenome TaxID=1076179 RepID=A0A645FRV1_9ZZZZ
MQQRVDQHRAVAVTEHEAVAVRPLGVGRIVLEVVPPQHLGNFCHPHRGARMAGVGLLYRIHRQRTDGAGERVENRGLDVSGLRHGCLEAAGAAGKNQNYR